MQYSFRNTLCGLAVVIAAGLLAEHAHAQTIDLTGNEDAVTLAPAEESTVPEEISIFDEQMGDVSLPDSDLSSSKGNSTPSDVIPMEGESDEDSTTISLDDSVDFEDDVNEDGNKVVSDTLPVSIENTEVTGKLLGAQGASSLGGSISKPINSDLFIKMSDLEKQTTLLNLQLKKERVQNEISAVKAQRLKAQQEEEARIKEEERKEQEWRNEQERLLVAEQTKLKEAEIAMEKLRQEKILKAYKATLLESTQKWIKTNAEVYKKMAEKEKEIKDLMEDNQKKMNSLKTKAEDLKTKAEAARVAHEKKVANLESQISILKTRLEAEIESAKRKIAAAQASSQGKKNPFAVGLNNAGLTAPLAVEKAKMSTEYAIMEIIGQGEELVAKLINMEGDVFMVKVGTTLRNGFTIDEITRTYISGVNDDVKDVLYFSAGGVLDQEPIASGVKNSAAAKDKMEKSQAPKASRPNVTSGIPSLSSGMFIR